MRLLQGRMSCAGPSREFSHAIAHSSAQGASSDATTGAGLRDDFASMLAPGLVTAPGSVASQKGGAKKKRGRGRRRSTIARGARRPPPRARRASVSTPVRRRFVAWIRQHTLMLPHVVSTWLVTVQEPVTRPALVAAYASACRATPQRITEPNAEGLVFHMYETFIAEAYRSSQAVRHYAGAAAATSLVLTARGGWVCGFIAGPHVHFP